VSEGGHLDGSMVSVTDGLGLNRLLKKALFISALA
jgi:hypothetical protein